MCVARTALRGAQGKGRAINRALGWPDMWGLGQQGQCSRVHLWVWGVWMTLCLGCRTHPRATNVLAQARSRAAHILVQPMFLPDQGPMLEHGGRLHLFWGHANSRVCVCAAVHKKEHLAWGGAGGGTLAGSRGSPQLRFALGMPVPAGCSLCLLGSSLYLLGKALFACWDALITPRVYAGGEEGQAHQSGVQPQVAHHPGGRRQGCGHEPQALAQPPQASPPQAWPEGERGSRRGLATRLAGAHRVQARCAQRDAVHPPCPRCPAGATRWDRVLSPAFAHTWLPIARHVRGGGGGVQADVRAHQYTHHPMLCPLGISP